MSAEEGVVKVCALLGFYAVWNGSFLQTLRYNLSGNVCKVQARVFLTVWNSSREIVKILDGSYYLVFPEYCSLFYTLYLLNYPTNISVEAKDDF